MKIQVELATRSILTIQDMSLSTAQRINSKLIYYFEGEAFLAQRQFDSAIDAFRKLIVLYPEDHDFRETLGRVLASAGREDEAKIELDEAARLRGGPATDASIAKFVGLWQFPDRLVWVDILSDGRTFQCRIGPGATVYKSEGLMWNGQIEWQETWGTETLTRTNTGIAVVGESANYELEMAKVRMVPACEAPF